LSEHSNLKTMTQGMVDSRVAANVQKHAYFH